MDWEAVGAVGQVLGSVAVFATLGYLAVQVRHAVAHAQFSSTNATLALFANAWTGVVQSPAMANVLAKMETNEELSPGESAQADAFAHLTFIAYTNADDALGGGLIPRYALESYQTDLARVLIKYPQMRQRLRDIVDPFTAKYGMNPIWQPLYEEAPATTATHSEAD